MEEKDAIIALAALAQPVRLRVFRALVGAGPEGLTPGALAQTLEVAAPTLSFHLKELMHAKLVDQERSGRNLIYCVAFEQMNTLLAFLTAHCCAGQPCLPEPTTCAPLCAPKRKPAPSRSAAPTRKTGGSK